MGKPVGAAISRPPTFETERLDKTLYPVSWRAASSRPYEACRLSEVSVAVSLFPLIRPGLRPVHLPRRGRRPPGGGPRRVWGGTGTDLVPPLFRPLRGHLPPGEGWRAPGGCFFSSGGRSRPGNIPPGLRLCSGGLWKCCGYPPENRRTGSCKGTG